MCGAGKGRGDVHSFGSSSGRFLIVPDKLSNFPPIAQEMEREKLIDSGEYRIMYAR